MANLKPIIAHTGRTFTKEEKAKRAESESYFRVGRLRLVPPPELTERAKMKFEQIANEAFWLDELSGDLLAAYCVAWDKYLDTVEACEGVPEVLSYITPKGETVNRQNPYRRALSVYVEQMCLLSSKLGIGNIDRLKLSLPMGNAKKEENPFQTFMEQVE